MSRIFTKELREDAIERAIRTMAQAALGYIGTATLLSQVDWCQLVSATLLAGIVSIIMSIAGAGVNDTISPASVVGVPEAKTVPKHAKR